MPVERSAGAIVFRKERGKIFYLLLHYPGASHRSKKDYWEFPKGHIESGEKEIDAMKREVKEETGIDDLKIVEGFKKKIKYFFRWQGKNILKFVTFYLGETKKKKIKLSSEHIGYAWLPFEEAIEKLSFKNSKEIFKEAKNFLEKLNF